MDSYADNQRTIAEGTTSHFVKLLAKSGFDGVLGVAKLGGQPQEFPDEFLLAMRAVLG